MSKTFDMYKEGLSKQVYKKKLRLFWTKYWKYNRTPEEWVDLITHNIAGGSAIRLVTKAIHKLRLEHKISKDEEKRLIEMINSNSREDCMVALTVMKSVKPNKFKKQ